MDQYVDSAPLFSDLAEHLVDLGLLRHVAWENCVRVYRFRKRSHTLLECFAGVGEDEARALLLHGLRDAPGDAAFIRNAENENTFSLEESAVSHTLVLTRFGLHSRRS